MPQDLQTNNLSASPVWNNLAQNNSQNLTSSSLNNQPPQDNNIILNPDDPNFYTDFLNIQVPQVQYLDKNGLDLTKFENNPILRADPELKKYENLLIDLEDGTFFGKKQTSDEEMSKLWDQRYYGDAPNAQNNSITQVSQVNSNSSQVPNLSNFLNKTQSISQNQVNFIGSTNQQNYSYNQNTQNPFQQIQNFSSPAQISAQNVQNFQQPNLNNYVSNSFKNNPVSIANPLNNANDFIENVSNISTGNDTKVLNVTDTNSPNTSANLLNQSLTSQLAPQVNTVSVGGASKVEARTGTNSNETQIVNESKSEQDTQVESQVEKIKEQLKEEAAKERLIKPQQLKTSNTDENKDLPKDLSKTIESVLGSIKLYGYAAPSSAINKIARSKDPKSLYKNFDTYSARSWLFALLGKLALKQKEEQAKKK